MNTIEEDNSLCTSEFDMAIGLCAILFAVIALTPPANRAGLMATVLLVDLSVDASLRERIIRQVETLPGDRFVVIGYGDRLVASSNRLAELTDVNRSSAVAMLSANWIKPRKTSLLDALEAASLYAGATRVSVITRSNPRDGRAEIEQVVTTAGLPSIDTINPGASQASVDGLLQWLSATTGGTFRILGDE